MLSALRSYVFMLPDTLMGCWGARTCKRNARTFIGTGRPNKCSLKVRRCHCELVASATLVCVNCLHA